MAAAPSFDITTVYASRKKYVEGIVAMVKALHIDGVTWVTHTRARARARSQRYSVKISLKVKGDLTQYL